MQNALADDARGLRIANQIEAYSIARLRSPPAQRSSRRRSDFRCAAIRSPVVLRTQRDLYHCPSHFSPLWAGACLWQTYGFEIVEFHTHVSQNFTVDPDCKLCGVLNLKADGSAMDLTANREVAGECRGTLLV